MTVPWPVRAKEGVLLLGLAVALPTADGFFDLRLSFLAYLGGDWMWASALLLPVICNLAFTMAAWWRLERGRDRVWTWALVPLLVWPQWKALKLFWSIVCRGDEDGFRRKKEFERNVGGLEPFYESVPQARYLGNFNKTSTKPLDFQQDHILYFSIFA
jgi:hypothetical protein